MLGEAPKTPMGLEKAAVLVCEEMLGSDKAWTQLLEGTDEHTIITVAFHTVQSCAWFALKEHNVSESIPAENKLAIDLSQMDQIWPENWVEALSVLQAWWWSP